MVACFEGFSCGEKFGRRRSDLTSVLWKLVAQPPTMMFVCFFSVCDSLWIIFAVFSPFLIFFCWTFFGILLMPFFGWRWLIDFCWWLIDLCCWVVGLTPHPVPVTTRMTLHVHLKKSQAAAKSSLSIFTGTGGRFKWVADVLEEKCLPRRATKTSKRNYAKKSSVDPQASAE